MRDVTDATFEPTCSQAGSRSSSTSGRRGAARARRSSRSSRSCGDVEFVKLDIDENPATASRYDVLSIPTVILFADGEARETVVGARPKKHFERRSRRTSGSSERL